MRVTNNMIAQNVAFNMHRAIGRFLEMQTQMSSGRRINKPSDDPVGAIRDLDYRTELAKNQQYRGAISQALNWMNTYESTLDDINSMLSTARELAVAMSNDTYDETARLASANEVNSILERIIYLGNEELEGKAIFGGFKTNVKPIAVSANGVRYLGDLGIIDFQIENSSRMSVNLLGNNVFLKPVTLLGKNSDVNIALTGGTLLSDLNVGNGITLPPGTITLNDLNLGLSSTIDLSAAVTIDDIINTINAQLTADGITNITAGLGPEGNNLKFTTTPNSLISNLTTIEKLNSGSGIQMSPGKILVTDGVAVNVEVDFSGASTIGDIINDFNSQLATAGINNVTMQINAAGTGLEINDTNGTPLGLRIEEVSNESTTAVDLGILNQISPQLVGLDLNPAVGFEIIDTVGNTAAELGIKAIFSNDLVGDDLNPLLLATSNVADFNNGVGFGLGEIIIKQGENSKIIDLSDPTIVTVQDMLDAINNSGLNVTASLNAAGTGIQVVNDDINRSLIIEEVSNGRTARTLGIFGSSDLIGTVMVLHNALENNDREGTELLLEQIDNVLQHLLNQRATVASRSLRLESTDVRLIDRDLNFTKLLSEVEDADFTKLVTDLTTFENNYQASLMAGARIIQPTLLEFLR